MICSDHYDVVGVGSPLSLDSIVDDLDSSGLGNNVVSPLKILPDQPETIDLTTSEGQGDLPDDLAVVQLDPLAKEDIILPPRDGRMCLVQNQKQFMIVQM